MRVYNSGLVNDGDQYLHHRLTNRHCYRVSFRHRCPWSCHLKDGYRYPLSCHLKDDCPWSCYLKDGCCQRLMKALNRHWDGWLRHLHGWW